MNFDVSSCTKFQISDPDGGAYSAPPGPIAGGDGARCTAPYQEPYPVLGPSVLGLLFSLYKHSWAPKRS